MGTFQRAVHANMQKIMIKSKKFQQGLGLLEAVVSLLVLSLLMLTAVYMYQRVIFASVRTREIIYSTQLAEFIFSKLKSIEYYYLFNYDSAKPNFGLSGTYGPTTAQRNTYPYLGLLNEITTMAKKYKIDRWTVDIKFKIRDTSDIDGDGLISDLRDFIDTDNNLIDDYDPSIRYHDANNDSDYYDTYSITLDRREEICSELPDTNLKEVTLNFFKSGRLIHTQQELISLEMLSGKESKASGAALKLSLTQPANDTYLYDLTTPDREKAFNLPITKSYPPEIIASRADILSPIRLRGRTSPLSIVKFYLNTTENEIDNCTANMLGDFNFCSLALTTALREGKNTILVQATKDEHFSPYTPRTVILDLNPPSILNQTPIGTVRDLMPYVGATLIDTVLSGGIPSGICQEVITMKCNAIEVRYKYNPASGDIYWIDPATNLPPKLSSGTVYSITLEGGDNAHYKVSSTWTFTIEIQEPDDTAPSIVNERPTGITKEPLPEISCHVFDNQSGIDVFSIIMKVNGQIVVSSSNISEHYDPKTGVVRFKPPSPFPNNSTQTVEVCVSHWANEPPDKKTSVKTWNFTVMY